ncbi:hypothetical protein ACIRSU_24840 [Streptomyces sp. NPDC101160]
MDFLRPATLADAPAAKARQSGATPIADGGEPPPCTPCRRP